MSVDGYLLCENLPASRTQTEHFHYLADLIRSGGITAGLGAIRYGSYNLIVSDLARRRTHVANDHLASIPFYHGTFGDLHVLSSNPVAIARSHLLPNTFDWLACAEWMRVGYSFGSRYFLREVRLLDANVCLQYDHDSGEVAWLTRPPSPIDKLPEAQYPSIDQLNSALKQSLDELGQIDPHPAHFMSAGKDSRLLLAAWPTEYDPPCYTYGNPDSHEFTIAQQVARLRGSEWIHIWPHGDEAASHIESMFDTNGLIVFPDRYIAAKRIAENGHEGVMDGLLGDTFMGWGYHQRSSAYAGMMGRILRHITIYHDDTVDSVGLERYAGRLYVDIQDPNVRSALSGYIRADFLATLDDHDDAIREDLMAELRRCLPANGSLGLLRRRFMLANRSAHAIIHQGTMCRAFVQPYYPFASDLGFLELQRRIPLQVSSFNRPIIRIFRTYYPAYGKIPYGASLLPLNAPPLRHQLSQQLIGRGLFIPGLSGQLRGKARDANSWGVWLRQSAALRDVACEMMRQGGILDEAAAAITMQKIATGEIAGTGLMFHMAAIAKWLRLAQR
ncbi:MAG: hypothetical protein AB1644_04370 [Candidatus Zixiibacteriota bacterium]